MIDKEVCTHKKRRVDTYGIGVCVECGDTKQYDNNWDDLFYAAYAPVASRRTKHGRSEKQITSEMRKIKTLYKDFLNASYVSSDEQAV